MHLSPHSARRAVETVLGGGLRCRRKAHEQGTDLGRERRNPEAEWWTDGERNRECRAGGEQLHLLHVGHHTRRDGGTWTNLLELPVGGPTLLQTRQHDIELLQAACQVDLTQLLENKRRRMLVTGMHMGHPAQGDNRHLHRQ
eukprot:TRINITY_DN5930_c0_g1_i2.p2 TRINITY_DN5930_c0_g1~~TRINITY_DN5930_c0_g1_i2.p2  ORF type:complete len:142 (+),score=3.64 TRINITY_DN5930_c0_g1_i2:216-641(+)